MCRLAAAVGVDNAAEIVREMLLKQQHGGQEGAGIATEHEGRIYDHTGLGLVDEVFRQVDLPRQLPGNTAIGHVRYATTGGSTNYRSLQPFVVQTRNGPLAIAHNGNLTDYEGLKRNLLARGCVLHSDSDTELILALLSHSQADNTALRLMEMFGSIQGAATLLVMEPGRVWLGIDPYNWRPLVYASYEDDREDGFLVASETRALKLFGVRNWTVVKPGELVCLEKGKEPQTFQYANLGQQRHCVFEKVYFAMPDSEIFGDHVGAQRRNLGTALAAKMPPQIEVIVPVPNSANVAAEAVAVASGKALRHGIIRTTYGRTFIMPHQVARERGVRMKLDIDESVIRGKHVGVVDDSIVRGTTTRKIVQLLREAGALSVHLLVSSPPVIHPCHWGIDTPRRDELIAARVSPENIAAELGVDSVTYLTEDELLAAVADPQGKRHCTYCFTGRKPVEHHQLPDEDSNT